MIRLGLANKGTHTIRFYPNIEDLKNNRIIQEYYCYEKQEITANQYWQLKKDGYRPNYIKRFYSYAKVDGEYGLFAYGLTINKFIRACMEGRYYIKDGNLFLEEEVRNERSYQKVEFDPFNIFDVTHNKAIRFDIEEESGFARMCNFSIIENDDNIIFRPGDDKKTIEDFFRFHIEVLPEKFLF